MLPSKREIDHIIKALSGWPDDVSIVAPSYFPTEAETNCLFNLINYKTRVPESIFLSINKNKARAENYQNLFINETIKQIVDFKEETKEFIDNFSKEIAILDKVLIKIGFSKKEKELYHLFVSKTAPILYYMGFADAIKHAAQVSKKCIVEAYKRNCSKTEVLQAAMVGWIHDPKVPIKYSWSNLTTHPVIASAIAIKTMSEKEYKMNIEFYLNKLYLYTNIDSEKFINGTAEALAINNDSEYVFRNGILYRPDWTPGPSEPGGIIDQILLLSNEQLSELNINDTPQNLAQKVEEKAIKWFNSSAEGKANKVFDEDVKKILNYIQLETGLRGIIIDKFDSFYNKLSSKHNLLKDLKPAKALEKILNGEINDKGLVSEISHYIQTHRSGFDRVFEVPTISAKSLFASYLEVEDDTIAALALEISDPLLLSPHKLLAEGVKDTAYEQIMDFLDSFYKNILYLPFEAKMGGKIWQRDLYVSIIISADKLTGQDNLNKFLSKYSDLDDIYKPNLTSSAQNIDLSIIEKQIDELTQLIQDTNTWQRLEDNENILQFNRKDPEKALFMEQLFDILKENYEIAADNSPEMFGLVTIDTFAY